ncbi:arsenate reductase (glutaredoxin) [Glaesserella parasuis]|uniref:arsenate reductase (glutaredoxin) n=1 Tax=Glaesserella parasuis TaxID=738 RepID=UPI0007A0D140|nr:arsenate reductase (glutaredoxin) [Glaesserella parasuis]AMW16829.1 arsenate reductase (glutaredoxin) [Glaesserella parasuis]MDG6271477.1 arsenate reductase (glutaredoxin) [Glaesserella parasuis]MDG6307028.1 arsenate reductase (glutaredoxin) [Glaesserella parasuis]MDG6343449.1 arsenate reductase (glutaredoxin) [Glaesserella parasuis]MDG6486015.1 arsenate reductase (glutaredoxin) [Glaesserella parasuis]
MLTIYHNPKCSKSRETLAIIQAAGIEPIIIEYLNVPLDITVIKRLITESGLSVREAIRTNVEAYQQITPEMSDNDIFALIAKYPNLLNRPFVSGQKGTKLCRPPELVNTLL